MRRFLALLLLAAGLVLTGCPGADNNHTAVEAGPPAAGIEARELTMHDDTRIDDYYWLNDREDPEVIAYLEAENAYTDEVMAHTLGLQKTLFEEFTARIKQNDRTVPYREGDYFYYSRTKEGKQYQIHCRSKGSPDGPEEVLLDVNALAEGHGYFAVGARQVSDDQLLLAYAVDTQGRRFYDIHFKDLTTGGNLPDVIPDVTRNLVWAADSRSLFYVRQDPVTLRPYRVYRHVLGADPADDALVFEETDETFDCRLRRTMSRRFILIVSDQTLATETRYLDASDPAGDFTVFLPRRRDHEYHLDHLGDRFYIRTNLDAPNFRLLSAPPRPSAPAEWEELVAHRDDVLLEDFELFRDHLLIEERADGLVRFRVRAWADGAEHLVDFEDPTYSVAPVDNHEPDTAVLRFEYESLATPRTVYDYDMATQAKTPLKREEVGGGFDSAHYTVERLHAPARDGVEVPISLVHREGFARDGSAPLLLYGYGSYGLSMDADFDPYLISLLDRGFVYAIAHVRGGQELGRDWYEDGKLFQKMNTFTDFIDCAEYLVGERYTRPDRLFAEGASAGGLLIGAVINLRPDLFLGAIAGVPFVDVVTTMLDDTIPLTTGEYDEWGNPNEKAAYEYMLSYSPYDNVTAQAYPHLLVTTGLHDSQVQYFEPAKWVAKLRARKTDDHRLLLKTEMEAGHGGVSGRYQKYREIAFDYAFLLDLAGINK